MYLHDLIFESSVKYFLYRECVVYVRCIFDLFTINQLEIIRRPTKD